MSDLCYKSLDVEVKAADEDAGTVSLYAAAFNNVDRQGEVIAPGAFANLSEFTADGWLGLAHDMRSLPVATVESAVQDGVGLLLTCRSSRRCSRNPTWMSPSTALLPRR